MKGLVLSLKPFKQKNRNVYTGEIAGHEDPISAQKPMPVSSGRGFFRDPSGNALGRPPAGASDEDFEGGSGQISYGREGGKSKETFSDRRKSKRRGSGFDVSFSEGDYPNYNNHKNNNYNNYNHEGGYPPYIKGAEPAAAGSAGFGAGSMELYSGEIKCKNSGIGVNEGETVKKHILSVFFALALLLGVFCGTAAASGINIEIMNSLEFLMFTDAGAQGVNGALQVFSSAFAVNFIYLTLVFLVGLSPWGMGVIPFVCLFKGFETGLVASYLVNSFDWGMAYYFLVIAPGIFIFSLALIIQSGHSVRVSSALGRFLFTTRQDSGWIRDNIKAYMYKSGSMMILATAAALANTFMWMVCSSMFDF